VIEPQKGMSAEDISAKMSLSREEIAHKVFGDAVAKVRHIEKQLDPCFAHLQKAMNELASLRVEVTCKMNPYMTEAWREWQVKEQVKKERAK